MTRKKRHAEAEVSAKLSEANALAAQGRTQDQIATALGISVMTFHRWRKRYGSRSHSTDGSNVSPLVPIPDPGGEERLSRIAGLQLENTRLRKLVTDLLLEKMRLEEETEQSANRANAKKR